MRFCTGVALAALLLASGTALADGLIDNVDGLTLDGTGAMRRFTGILIDKEGRVVRTLERTDKRPDKLDYRYDGKGRSLLPGLVDAHGHVMQLGFARLSLDLSETRSLAEAQARIAAYVAANPGRPWILGTGWNQERWGLGRFPTAAELDAVTGGVPAWLERADSHAGWANSAALKAAGITATTKAPPGGRIEMAGGRPAGVLFDNARALVDRVVPPPLPKDYDAAFLKAQDRLLSLGVTTIADMGMTIQDWQTYRRAGDRGALRLRIIGYALGIDQMVMIAGPAPTPWLYDDRLRLAGVKLHLDGALGSRGAWLKAPYADAPGETGLPRLDGTQLRNQMSRAAMDGFQVAVHAIGDRANAEALDAIEEIGQTYKGDRRWRIEQAQIVDPADLPRFGRNGIIASMQPVHATSDWRMATARLGEARLAGAYAWASMIANRVPLAFGSDVPVEQPNGFAGISAAMTREDDEGEPAGGWHPEQRIGLADALAAYTRGAAFAGFAEDRIGTLTPGRRADFVIVDRDIELTRPFDIRATQVLESWVGGQRVYVKDEAK
jgi:hypothetical protein